MSSSSANADFLTLFQAAQRAFERGQYRQSLELLESALEQVQPGSRPGGEAQLWRVNAYQALGETDTAIAHCQSLINHPFVAKPAQDLLYILKAPVLNRPKEWLTEIPDLQNLEPDGGDRYNAPPPRPRPMPQAQPELDPSQINDQDNQFVLWAAIVLAIICGGLFFLA
ncbi:MAG: tetratricopeptide repeat protein [Spirulinaceae cyanobacterium]